MIDFKKMMEIIERKTRGNSILVNEENYWAVCKDTLDFFKEVGDVDGVDFDADFIDDELNIKVKRKQ